MKIEDRAIDTIFPYDKNPRQISEHAIEAVAASIREYGFRQPLVVDTNGALIVGHTRLKAAQHLDLKTVPVHVADLTPEQIQAYRIADNRLGELSEWDDDLLREELTALEAETFDLELTGFDEAALADLLGPEEGQTDPDDTPEPPAEPITKPGDLWRLGTHRLLCGDCTDKDQVERLLDGATPNLMVTDPPYGVEYDGGWRADLESPTRPDLEKYNERVKPGSFINVDVSDWSAMLVLLPCLEIAYMWTPALSLDTPNMLVTNFFELRAQIIWRKPSLVVNRGHYNWQHEVCLYAVKKGKTASWIGDARQSTVWDIGQMGVAGHSQDEDDIRTSHITQKPVECMERPIRNHKGDVYDPFCGSGTTLIAAERQRRTCYAMEIEPAYVDIAVQRWEAYTDKKAERVTGE